MQGWLYSTWQGDATFYFLKILQVKGYVGRRIHGGGAVLMGEAQVSWQTLILDTSWNLCWILHISPGTPCRWQTRTCSTSWAPSRLGCSNLSPVNGISTHGAAALRSTRAASSPGWETGWTIKKIKKKNWKIKNKRLNQCRNAAKHGVSLLHGNCQAFTTIPSKDGKKPPNPRQPYIIIYIFF